MSLSISSCRLVASSHASDQHAHSYSDLINIIYFDKIKNVAIKSFFSRWLGMQRTHSQFHIAMHCRDVRFFKTRCRSPVCIY
jgi:hypothetical protein